MSTPACEYLARCCGQVSKRSAPTEEPREQGRPRLCSDALTLLTLVGEQLDLISVFLEHAAHEGTFLLPRAPVSGIRAARVAMVRCLAFEHLAHKGELALECSDVRRL